MWFASISFTSFKKIQLYCPIIHPVNFLVICLVIRSVICLVIRLVVWCFPITLTSSLSYPMAIFSGNEIRTFYLGKAFDLLYNSWVRQGMCKKLSSWDFCFVFTKMTYFFVNGSDKHVLLLPILWWVYVISKKCSKNV